MNAGIKKGLLFVSVCVVALLILYAVWPSKMIDYLTTPASSENDAADTRFFARSNSSGAMVIRKKIPGVLQEVEASFDRNKPIVITKKVPSGKAGGKKNTKINPSNDISPIPAAVSEKVEQKSTVTTSSDTSATAGAVDKSEPQSVQTEVVDKSVSKTISKGNVEYPEKKHQVPTEGAKKEKSSVASSVSEPAPRLDPEKKAVIAKAGTSVIEKPPAASTGTSLASDAGQKFVPKPYSIMLASCRRMDSAESVIKKNRRKGLFPYAVRVDLGQKGIWWRVFEGNYASATEASGIKRQHQLTKALVKKTPYAISIGAYNNETDAAVEVKQLIKLKHSPYFLPGPENKVRLLVGAFVNKDGARQLQDELTARGINNQVVIR